MARVASPGDFTVAVEGLGDFTFGRRTMRDEFAIAAEYSRLTEGEADPESRLAYLARAYAALKVLLVSGHDGWKVTELEPQENASYTQMELVYEALCVKEADFRKKPGAVGQG